MATKTTIALILPVGLEYSSQIARGVANYLTHNPCFQALELPFRYGGRSPLPRKDWDFAGAILWAHPRDTWVPNLVAQGVKTVNCGGDWHGDGVVAVGFNAVATAQRAGEYLARLGHRSYAFVAHGLSEQPSAQVLCEQLQKSLPKNSQFAVLDLAGADPCTDAQRRMGTQREPELIKFLTDLPRPASVWCGGDDVAVLVTRIARRINLRIPEDLAVLGLGDYMRGRFHDPPISSIPQPGELVGLTAAQVLQNLLDGAAMPADPIRLEPPQVVERLSTVRAADSQDDIRRAFELIQANATQGLTVNSLMHALSISQKTLNDRFRRAYGRTPGEQIRHVRLERAKQLLADTDLNITTIAHICGFQNLNRFNIFFKREAGMAPSVFRRQETE